MGQGSGVSFLRSLGPGLLFAGAAVGVSHLVQSTRAGAEFGLALVGVVLLACLLKYPAFSFGPRYAAATNTSLLEGYRRQGRWALVLYALLTLGTMFTVQAAVTLVTAALLAAVFGIPPVVGSVALTVICIGLLALGRYPWLERVIKAVMALLTVTTLVAAAVALPSVDWSSLAALPPAELLDDPKRVLFLAALIGWMPSAIDISVWQSLWTLAKGRKEGSARPFGEVMRDFKIGYLGTVLLAICFLVMGAGVMHGTGITPDDRAGVFAGQVISLFTESLGEWSYPLIATACITVMFSTTLTVIDGFPRAIGTLMARFKAEEQGVLPTSDGPASFPAAEAISQPVYYLAMGMLAAGSLSLIGFAGKSLTSFVDVATVLSFCTAAPLSWLNHRAICSPAVPLELRPGPGMQLWSWLGIAFAVVFTVWYLWVTFGG